MRIKQKLRTIVLVTAIGLAGCSPKPKDYIEGTVVKEYGNVARIVESSGALFGNESVKLGNPNYGLIVETSRGKYTIDVDVSDKSGSSGPKTAYNLAARIEEGTKIRFPTTFDGRSRTNKPIGFTDDKVGYLDPDDIQILE